MTEKEYYDLCEKTWKEMKGELNQDILLPYITVEFSNASDANRIEYISNFLALYGYSVAHIIKSSGVANKCNDHKYTKYGITIIYTLKGGN